MAKRASDSDWTPAWFRGMRCLAVAAAAACAALAQSGTAVLRSPDGHLEMTFQTVVKNETVAAGGQLTYKVSFQGKPVIALSALRLELQGQSPLGSSVRLVAATPSRIDEIYHLVAGKASTVRNYCNTLRVDLEETGDPGRKLVVEARAYDDAVAFRYLVPEQGAIPNFQLTNETTEFRASKDATGYALELPDFRSMYESEFIKLPISA